MPVITAPPPHIPPGINEEVIVNLIPWHYYSELLFFNYLGDVLDFELFLADSLLRNSI